MLEHTLQRDIERQLVKHTIKLWEKEGKEEEDKLRGLFEF